MGKEKFNSDLQYGKAGEYIIYQYLLFQPNTSQLINVTDDEFFQENDIDFVWETVSGKVYKIELKTDRLAHKTGNIVYEYKSNKSYDTVGCFEKTKADYILYYIEKTNVLYWIKVESLREYIEKNKEKLSLVNMGDNAIGYLIPLKIVEAENMGHKINGFSVDTS